MFAFSSFMHEYLDPVVKTDQCAQYVNDIGIEPNNDTDLTRNIRAVLNAFAKQDWSWRSKRAILDSDNSNSLVELFHQNVFQRRLGKFKKNLANWDPHTKKCLQRYLGFINYYRNFIPTMAGKHNSFYKLLNVETANNIISELEKTFDWVNKALSDACEWTSMQPIPRKKIVLMTDSSVRSAGYALMIEDNPDQKKQSKRRTDAPVAFRSNIFSLAQLKISIYSKEILAIYLAFLEFAHIFSEATIVPTDNKSVTRLFQKMHSNPRCLWVRNAIYFQSSSHCRINQHCSWLALQIRT